MYGFHIQDSEHLTDDGTTTLCLAAGSGDRYHIDKIIIGCYSIGTDIWISVTDGTTVFIPQFLVGTTEGMEWEFDFGPGGWKTPKNATVTLTVTDAGGKAVSCVTYATALARKVTN